MMGVRHKDIAHQDDDMTALDRLNDQIISCRRCPRLAAWREQAAMVKKRAYRDEEYWGRPLPGFGDEQARLLILGLAPAAHGGNRTGRMFTGDRSGDVLFISLHRAGFANQPTSRHRGDGLLLHDAYITAAARCAPPANRPTPDELRSCRMWLEQEIALLPSIKIVVALGQIAFSAYLRVGGQQEPSLPRPLPPFGHNKLYRLADGWPILISSYHPSRQNTQTGRLTQDMLDAVFLRAREVIAAPARASVGVGGAVQQTV
jgi:uracil-DNA glycosylase